MQTFQVQEVKETSYKMNYKWWSNIIIFSAVQKSENGRSCGGLLPTSIQ